MPWTARVRGIRPVAGESPRFHPGILLGRLQARLPLSRMMERTDTEAPESAGSAVLPKYSR